MYFNLIVIFRGYWVMLFPEVKKLNVEITNGDSVKVTGKVNDLVNIVKAIIDNKFYCLIHTYTQDHQGFPNTTTLNSSVCARDLWTSDENGELVAVLVIFTGGLISMVDLSTWIKSFDDCIVKDDFYWRWST